MILIVLARVRVFRFWRIDPVYLRQIVGTLVGPVAMTRDAGCELNLVPTLRHMIMTKQSSGRTLMEMPRLPDPTSPGGPHWCHVA